MSWRRWKQPSPRFPLHPLNLLTAFKPWVKPVKTEVCPERSRTWHRRCVCLGTRRSPALLHNLEALISRLSQLMYFLFNGISSSLLFSSLFLMEGLRYITINVNGIWESPKRHAFLQWLDNLKPHFACLQETHVLSCAEATSWFPSSGFQAISSPGTNHSCGTIILYRPEFQLVNSWTDREGQFVQAEFVKRGVTFRVVEVYFNRNPERENFYTYVEDMVDPARPTILCGNFNAVFDRTTDRRGSNALGHSHDSCRAIRTLFLNCCVTEISRHLHSNKRGVSWCRWHGTIASRIDLIGCPTSWQPYALTCSLSPCPFSDHSAVSFTCSLPACIPRGPGRWKLNCSVLETSEYINVVRDFGASWQTRKPSFTSI